MTFQIRALWCFLFLVALPAAAAPILRLAGTSLNPIWISTGTNGPTNVAFEAYNIGDGSLNLQVKGSQPWLTPSIGASRACSFDGSRQCLPVQVLFSSTALAAGAYDGRITVSDPNALDSPQNVAIRIYVNGNVPSRVDFYLPPDAGANETQSFQSPQGPPPQLSATTQTGGNWLGVSSDGLGSFQFLYTNRVKATVQSGMAAGDYNGTLAVAGSSFANDNRSVPVVLHVTTQPIARLGAATLQFRGVQGAAVLDQVIPIANGGNGTLTLGTLTTSGGDWLTAALQDGVAHARVNPGALAPGFYNGSISVASNAANSPTVVPVVVEVQAASGPLTEFQGVVDAASFKSPMGAGALVSLFGSQLATATIGASSIPLPTTLANATVFVNNAPAPLIFVSAGQINFQMPFDASGQVQVRVDREGQRGNTVTAQVGRRAAGIYTFAGTPYGIVQNASRSNAFPWPDTPTFAGVPKAAARPGDVLVLYGSGFGPVNPGVATGAAAGSDTLSRLTENPRVSFGPNFFGPFADPLFVGLAPGFVGLYQLNVEVPRTTPASPATPVRLDWADGASSNTVQIVVER
jgi:uncharacterized protein (TIGR03437 family)